MALNLRKIEPDLHRRLKLAAFSLGIALERFCLDALEEFLDANDKDERQGALRGTVEQAITRVEASSRPVPNVVSKPRSNPHPVATPAVAVVRQGYVPPRFRS